MAALIRQAQKAERHHHSSYGADVPLKSRCVQAALIKLSGVMLIGGCYSLHTTARIRTGRKATVQRKAQYNHLVLQEA